MFEEHFEQKVERPVRLIEQKIGRNIDAVSSAQLEPQERHRASTTKCASSARGSRSRLGRRRHAVEQAARAHDGAAMSIRDGTGPVIELGPGTGPMTEALIEHGVDPARLVLVEFNPAVLRSCCASASRLRP